MDNYLASVLFKIKSSDDNFNEIQPPRISNVKDFFCNKVPKCMKCRCCCKRPPKSRNERALGRARAVLAEETSILALIRRLRYFELAIDQLLDDAS